MNRGGTADIILLRSLLAIRQKSQYFLQVKSKKSCKLIGQQYFGVITQNSMILFVASMEVN